MDARKIEILRHALGTGDDGRRSSYRNHFVTGPGSKDYDDCVALVGAGLMIQRPGNLLTGGDDLFQVTDAGRDAASPGPAPKLSASKQRYRDFLAADSGLSFGEWLNLRHCHRSATSIKVRG